MSKQDGTPTIPDFAEIGGTGLERWGQDIYEEFLPQLQYPRAAAIYKEMADNDATIGAIMYMSKQLIRKAGWKAVPASNSPADLEAAEFLESCMHDMSNSWASTISEILSMFTYGWSLHEVVYKIRRGPKETNPKFRSKYADGRVGWRKMPVRSQHTLHGWVMDDDGGIKGMIQMGPPTYKRVTIPLSKALLFRTETLRDNPEGRSLLRNAYRPWYFCKRIEEIEGIGIERDLAGLPVITPPENSSIWDPKNDADKRAKATAERIVRNVRRDRSEGLVLPYGWEFKLLSTGGTRQFDTCAIINRYDQRKAITMLSDIVMLGADKVGSFALADVKKSLLAASLEAQIQNIADIFNKYAVTQLFELNNFPDITELPKIVPGEVETPGLKELGDFFRATGMRIDDDYELTNYLRQVASVPELTEDQFKVMQEKREKLRDHTAAATAKSLENKRASEKSENKEEEEEMEE